MTEGKDQYPNRLIHETSPYLLQHAYNPVDWQPWSEETLKKAKAEGKPIIVSIGYAACHWCHVMERESFEDEQVAAYMNQHFTCIKVDREERPDVDQIYMDAVQAVSGQGGWPLNMFLTADAKPFYGGTYFPPKPVQGRPSWGQLLQWVVNMFDKEPEKVQQQADNLTRHISGIDSSLIAPPSGPDDNNEKEIENLAHALLGHADKTNGGFGHAPKFPNPFNIMLLMRLWHYTGKEAAIEHALLTLDKMSRGGIYDQIGGGFARYAVDEVWLVPHFEKMLYDNALLAIAYADAFKITGEAVYKETLEGIMVFVLRELTAPNGGFYSALDADSEGEEGKFYVWQAEEIDKLLGEKAELFKKYYDVSDAGNWEGNNILNRPVTDEQFVTEEGITLTELKSLRAACNEVLMAKRAARIRPGLDDKILVSWNALMVSALVKAYEVLEDEKYLAAAQKNIAFLLKNCWTCEAGEAKLYHSYKNVAKHPAFLDDYATLIQALLDLYQVTFDTDLIRTAKTLTDEAIEKFGDGTGSVFYYTAKGQADILYRKKELYDSVVPSGNSVMASVIYRLGVLLGEQRYHNWSAEMVSQVKHSVFKYPTSFGNWAMLLLQQHFPAIELAVVGKDHKEKVSSINKWYLPSKILMAALGNEHDSYPLLKGRAVDGVTNIYLCEGYTCKAPVQELDDLRNTLLVNMEH